ncbi:MBL fold metallo-hydrolase [Methylophilus sp. 13]|uniref:ComEC/Rec2 family competence protein n=1 Tax=Methylophilus sp. 13 TaxID=2781018 RepID=UPI00188F57A7|nr:MBL fold metallo-hydrolase [Methylophilus sp. 13]MBF5040315.1 MBL fold metallo-hydrolase [Methylophilus sp. 13]
MSGEVPYEIDFLPVGSGDKSGDAIACRWKEGDSYKVLVYDGGTKESGQALVDLIVKHYDTRKVDYVVNSHPDGDHASGLQVVLEQLQVGELWMHRPWVYSATIREYFRDGRITDNSLAERLQEKMAAAYKLETIASEKKIPLSEPFQGSKIGPFTVLSPEKEWYVHELIPAFAKSPDLKPLSATLDIAIEQLKEAEKKLLNRVNENWATDSLRENVSTSAENESSAILLGNFDNYGVLLTGDSGIKALLRASKEAIFLGYELPKILKFIQVPHHGSRNNVSPTVLDLIVGPKKTIQDENYTKTAFVSAGKDSSTHPRLMVVNALLRRGAKVISTKGRAQRHSHKTPAREGYSPSDPMKFSNEVESWD